MCHYQIGERARLANKWIPNKVERLLDAGCDDGNNANLLSKKSNQTWGIDVNNKALDLAKQRYPEINFSCCSIDKTPFENNFFDIIVMNDVLEHVDDEVRTLNEIHRILKPGGQFIISTPHNGLFAFLDPANYKYIIKNKLLLKLIYNGRGGSYDEGFHRHYTLGRFKSVLNQSEFAGKYKIEKVFRSGLLLGVLNVNLKVLIRRLVGEKAARKILTPLSWLANQEYWIPFGSLAYNISISVRKI